MRIFDMKGWIISSTVHVLDEGSDIGDTKVKRVESELTLRFSYEFRVKRDAEFVCFEK